MTKQEAIEWLMQDLPEGVFVEKEDLAKAFVVGLRKQRQIMDKMALELEKLSPKCEAMSEYRKHTAVRW